jgi:hypothetical protein
MKLADPTPKARAKQTARSGKRTVRAASKAKDRKPARPVVPQGVDPVYWQRILSVTGTATNGMSTDEIMRLTRGGD